MKTLNLELLKSNIENRINEDMAAGRVDGVVVIVNQNGKTVYENTFGSKTAGANDNEMRMDTMYRLASMTKPITGAAAMIAIQKGYFTPEDDICMYLDGFKDMDIGDVDENGNIIIKGKAKGQVKIKHCLTHSSGIGTGPVGDKIFAQVDFNKMPTLADIVDFYKDKPLWFEPGEAQLYSPIIGLDIIARIIEIKSGMPYAEFLKKELFEPLGMKDTTFAPTEEQWGRMVGMHNMVDGKSVPHPVFDNCVFVNFPVTYHNGGAGLASHAKDYIKFAQMLLDKGRVGDVQLIDEKLIEEMSKPQLPFHVMPAHEIWGYTVRVIVAESYKRLPVGAFGWSGAHGTHFFVDPVNNVCAIYLKNSAYDGGSGAITAAHFEEDIAASYFA